MPSMGRASVSGPRSIRLGARKVNRGSRTRIRRIRLRENTPLEVLLLGIVLLLVVMAVVAWMLQHPDMHHH
jgi:hypothetical protein